MSLLLEKGSPTLVESILKPGQAAAKRRRNHRLNKLVKENIKFVERVLRNLGVPESELDDAAQRTFIVVANRLADIREGAERSFLFRSAQHMASHVRRARARRGEHGPLDEDLSSLEDSPEQLIGQKKARELLDAMLTRMPEDLRVVFALYELEQLKTVEIAELLQIPAGTVASRLRRARENFASQLKRMEASSRPFRPVGVVEA